MIRLMGGPLELDGTEVPDRYQVVIILDDAEFVPHHYWVVLKEPEGIWIGEYRGQYQAPDR